MKGKLLIIGIIALVLLSGCTDNTQEVEKYKTALCNVGIQVETWEIKYALENAVMGSEESFTYELHDCFTEEESQMQIIQRDDPRICEYYCGDSRQQCTLLMFTSPENATTKCLNIPMSTEFPLDYNPSGPYSCSSRRLDSEGIEYTIEEWMTTTIKPGAYTLINITDNPDEVPFICPLKQ